MNNEIQADKSAPPFWRTMLKWVTIIGGLSAASSAEVIRLLGGGT